MAESSFVNITKYLSHVMKDALSSLNTSAWEEKVLISDIKCPVTFGTVPWSSSYLKCYINSYMCCRMCIELNIYIDIFMWFKQSLFHMFTVMTAWCLSYVQSYGGKKLNVLFMDCTVLLKNKNCKYFTLNGYLSISNFLLYIHIFF